MATLARVVLDLQDLKKPPYFYPPNDKQQRIFDALLNLAQQNGIHNTPMSKLSKLSGVSTGAIYHDFSSKEELVGAVYYYVRCRLVDAALVGDNPDVSMRLRFERLWRNYFDCLVENAAYFSFIEQCSVSPIITPECSAQVDAYAKPVLDMLEASIAEGKLKNMDVILMGHLIYGSISATLKMQLMRGKLTKQHIDQAIDAIWCGLAC